MQKRMILVGAASGLLLAGAVGCQSVPDADGMRAIRADAAVERLTALEEKQPVKDGSVYLFGDLTLAMVLDRAMQYNLTLRQEWLEREIARGRILSSYEEALPAVVANGNYTRFDDDLAALVDGQWVGGRYQDQYSAGVKVSQTLFNGRIGAALRAAKLYQEWAEMGIRSAEEAVRYAVIEAYYSAVLSEHLLVVHEAALRTAETQKSDVAARHRQGMASNYEKLRAEVEVSNFQAEMLQARNDKDLAYTTLFRLIGASPESDVKLVDAIPHVQEEITFDAALRTALERRADLATAEYAVRMQRENIHSVKSRYLPTVSAFFTQDFGNPDPHDSSRDDWGDEWRAGIEASWTLFDGFGRKGELVQQEAQLKQLELALQDAEETVVSTIRQLVLSLKTAEEFAASQSKNLNTAEEALRLVQTGMREGQNSQVEVMDAREALTTASANYYQSLYKHALARVALQRAMGLLSDGALPHEPVLAEKE